MIQSHAEAAFHAVNRLRLLHDEEALLHAAGFGKDAIEPLRALLNEREPSGIYQPRCRAAAALGMIGAYDVLLDYLDHPLAIDNDIERAGEDAVINAAAHALGKACYPPAYSTLKRLAGARPCLMGVVEALGSYRRTDSIPDLVGALGEDGSRAVAEAELMAIGKPAVPALLQAALSGPPDGELEYSIQARKRRSAVKVLGAIGVGPPEWARLRPLMGDRDKWISALACGLALRIGTAAEQEEAFERLEALRRMADIWLLMHINDLLGHEGPEAEEGDGP
jgi:HEAT repeat protein